MIVAAATRTGALIIIDHSKLRVVVAIDGVVDSDNCASGFCIKYAKIVAPITPRWCRDREVRQ